MTEARPAVVAPLREEIAALLRRAERLRRVKLGGPGRFVDAVLAGRPVVLGWTGDGRRAARDGLAALLGERRLSHLVIVGVAGGLDPELRPGDVVAAREVRDAAGSAPPPARVPELPGTRPGVLVTHGHILARAADKLVLGRDQEGDTVDLETAVFARLAAEHGVPYIALRAVSDPAEEDLPVDFGRFCDADGQTRRWRVIVHALTHPRVIPALRRLQRRVDLCSERLCDAVIAWAEGALP